MTGEVTTKGLDEVFCFSCGSAVKQLAEICVHCGVRLRSTPAGRARHRTTVARDGVGLVATGERIVWIAAVIMLVFAYFDNSDTWRSWLYGGGWPPNVSSFIALLMATQVTLASLAGLRTLGPAVGLTWPRTHLALAVVSLLLLLLFPLGLNTSYYSVVSYYGVNYYVGVACGFALVGGSLLMVLGENSGRAQQATRGGEQE